MAKTLAERVEERVRTEWPETFVPLHLSSSPDYIRVGGATDTLINLMARIVAEESTTETSN